MAARGEVIELRRKVTRKPRRKTQSRRKAPWEWRALNRSHKVKDGRALLLAVQDPRRPGHYVIGEAYWHVEARAWYWANTAPSVAGCDPISDVYELAGGMWMPMPAETTLPLIAA